MTAATRDDYPARNRIIPRKQIRYNRINVFERGTQIAPSRPAGPDSISCVITKRATSLQTIQNIDYQFHRTSLLNITATKTLKMDRWRHCLLM